jgi:hypothetical protein
MLNHLLQRAVSQAARQPWRVLGLAMLLMLAAGSFAATHFDMSTDTGDMISSKTKWRQTEDSVSKAFPEANKGIAIVIDGRTPELAEDAAIRLAASLQGDKRNFVRVVRPDGGEFFDRNGLLFGTTDESKRSRCWAVWPVILRFAALPSRCQPQLLERQTILLTRRPPSWRNPWLGCTVP